MERNNLVLTKPDGFRGMTNVFDLEQLFYLPLKAVIDANTQAALSAINIIREYGFDNDISSEDYGKLKMITFSYDYAGRTGSLQTISVSLPFITLIPLPILEVKTAEIDFALNVLGQVDIVVDESDRQEISQNLMAVFAPENNTGSANLSVEANMNVNIRVGQSDLPGGIIQLLNLGQEATKGGNLFDLNCSPDILYFTKDKELKLRVEYEKKDNLPEVIIFDVFVQPSFKTEEAPFVQPIEILSGDLYGKATWQQIKVIPIESAEFKIFELQFFAGSMASNGFITIHSVYTNQFKIYYSIT